MLRICIDPEELLGGQASIQHFLDLFTADTSSKCSAIVRGKHFRIHTLDRLKQEQLEAPLFIHVMTVVRMQIPLQERKLRMLRLLQYILYVLCLLFGVSHMVLVLLGILLCQSKISAFQIHGNEGEQDPVGVRPHDMRFHIHVAGILGSSYIFVNLSANAQELGIQRLLQILGIQDLHSQAVFLRLRQFFYFINTCHAESGTQNISPHSKTLFIGTLPTNGHLPRRPSRPSRSQYPSCCHGSFHTEDRTP